MTAFRVEHVGSFVRPERLLGFSSGGGGGQTVTQDDTRRKLELIMETANDVWGTT